MKPVPTIACNLETSVTAIIKCDIEIIVVNAKVLLEIDEFEEEVDGGLVGRSVISGGCVE